MFGDHIGEIISLLFVAIALGMDAFSVSLGMGMQQLRLKRIMVIGFIFGLFHVILPFIGIIIGKFLFIKIGHIATLASGLILVTIGVQMILTAFNHESKANARPFKVGLLFIGLSISIDSFSVGLSMGISGVKTVIALFLFGIVSTSMTWAGLLLGKKVRGLLGVYSEIFGGSILCTFGLIFILGT
jgi:putative Mn2+ efflux pump MntP